MKRPLLNFLWLDPESVVGIPEGDTIIVTQPVVLLQPLTVTQKLLILRFLDRDLSNNSSNSSNSNNSQHRGKGTGGPGAPVEMCEEPHYLLLTTSQLRDRFSLMIQNGWSQRPRDLDSGLGGVEAETGSLTTTRWLNILRNLTGNSSFYSRTLNNIPRITAPKGVLIGVDEGVWVLEVSKYDTAGKLKILLSLPYNPYLHPEMRDLPLEEYPPGALELN